MTISEALARFDHAARPVLMNLPPAATTLLYSSVRNSFLARFSNERPELVIPPAMQEQMLWGLRFRSGVFNAAGIFKNGEGADMCFRQGAGAYLAGTTTAHARVGNARNGIAKPFAPYPRSGAASNWLGLPNDGHAAVAKRLAEVLRGGRFPENFPIGASLMTAPESKGTTALQELVEGLKLYEQAGVSFVEVNESCPNVAHGDSSLEAIAERLEYVRGQFLSQRKRILPVIVKFSTDTAPEDAPRLVDILLTLGFDGVNFGNTSTQYAKHRTVLAPQETKTFDYFTQTFGGGVSGAPLRGPSLALVRLAAEYLKAKAQTLQHEFHVIRTGGIDSSADVEASYEAGAALCQWYTGYFEGFAKHGHRVYACLYDGALATSRLHQS